MRSFIVGLVALVSALTISVHPALACSVCGCDPAAGTLGLDRPSNGSFRFALEDRYLSKESGTGDEAESERENRLVLRAQYAPVHSLVLQAEVPYFTFKRHLNAEGVNDDTAQGFGDATLGARFELYRSGLEARHVLSMIGTLKMPTGANNRIADPEEGPDEHIQLGTGSWDQLVGLAYSYGPRPWTLFANVTGRLNSANSRGFRYGHALFATAGARRSFLDSGKLIGSLEAQVRTAGFDRLGDGSVDPDSGGTVLYTTGSIAYALTDDLLMRAILQVPTATWLHGTQSEHPVAYVALSYDFAM
jgi:Putative MetA-pathway of phenol degradation